MTINPPQKLSVIGLGYVGLPLAVALAEHFSVLGFDIDRRRTEASKAAKTTPGSGGGSVGPDHRNLHQRRRPARRSDVVIVAVPTPVDDNKVPDLGPLRGACNSVGPHVAPGSVVVLESTVFPGATEEICGPILAELSGLVCGEDFFLGYSPERMNPGDTEHTVANIVKVVAGQTPEISALLAGMYGRITKAGIFAAKNIQTGEAAEGHRERPTRHQYRFHQRVDADFSPHGIVHVRRVGCGQHQMEFLGFPAGDWLVAIASAWTRITWRTGPASWDTSRMCCWRAGAPTTEWAPGSPGKSVAGLARRRGFWCWG